MRLLFASGLVLTAMSCAPATEDNYTEPDSSGVIIYSAENVLTMEPGKAPSAIAVKDGHILALGTEDELLSAFSGAALDATFVDKTIMPGFIDPHIHMDLSSIQYATPITPPWQMASATGMVAGLGTRALFLTRVAELDKENDGDDPLVIYGFHNLVHGDLTKADLDEITTDRPLIIWHYSSHDWYLNSAALDWAGIDASLHETYEGVGLDENGELNGRIFEDALPALLPYVMPILAHPERLATGTENFSKLLRSGGVTTVADLAYGVFPLALADANIKANWRSPEHAGYRLYLVPEHRGFVRDFKDKAAETALGMATGEIDAPAPVLPQVKFFTDAAFYSQTMRLSAPGYLEGQSKGSEGLWVIKPEDIANTIKPYWDIGLNVRIHSNGDAAQTATLAALAELRAEEGGAERRFVIEHAGLFSPQQVELAASLDAAISAASHYVFYMGGLYAEPLGKVRGRWILPLGSLSEAGVPVTVHSDAPLAPPLPLRAASVHVTRATREGPAYEPGQAMSKLDALEAITIDAAFALGLEAEIGSIKPGKRADFTILDANPLEISAEEWPEIGIWGVVLGGEKRPLN